MDHRIAANSKQAIFAGLRSLGTSEVARLLGCSESTVSELTSVGKYKLNFDSLPELLARMGLKVVPAENRCINPEKLDVLVKLAQMGMDKMCSADLWEG